MSEADLLSRLNFGAEGDLPGNETVSLAGKVIGWIVADGSRKFGWLFDFGIPHGQHGRIKAVTSRKEARDYFREIAGA